MKRAKTGKVALCGLIAALASVILLLSYSSYLLYTVPALAGLLMAVADRECGRKYAIITLLITALLCLVTLGGLILPRVLFIGFFGYYPLVKTSVERWPRPLAWMVKIAVFNVAAILCFVFLVYVLSLPAAIQAIGVWGPYSMLLLAVAGNVAFPIFDVLVTLLLKEYMQRIHPHVRRMK